MSQNIKIFQIYYKPELKKYLDSEFIPLDNTENIRPDLREWYVWKNEYETNLKNNPPDFWGFVSWKFKEKTNLDSNQVFNFLMDNPNYDVYLFNPCILNEACFINSWEQGNLHHPNISELGIEFLSKVGYNVDIKSLVIDQTKSIFANYIIGSKNFWFKFMPFIDKIFIEAEKDSNFKHKVFGKGLSNYAHDSSLPNFTFLLERLIPTFLVLENIKTLAFKYNKDNIHKKYTQFYPYIEALSTLKLLLNKYNDQNLYNLWNFYRIEFLKNNPGILNLE